MMKLVVNDKINTDLNYKLENDSIILEDNLETIISLSILKDTKIVLGKNSKITFLEKNSNKNYNLDITISDNSNVTFNSIDLTSDVNIKRNFNVLNNSTLKGVIGYLNDGNNKNMLNVNLNSEFAYADIKTVAIGKNSKMNIDINIIHNAKLTTGLNENYAISSKSDIIYNVIGKIENKMSESKSSQKTRGIILSDNAKIEANPALLIDEYNVMANHGASIGKISDEGLFYLMSRGLSKEDSLKLIVGGFLNPIYELLDGEYKDEFIIATRNKME